MQKFKKFYIEITNVCNLKCRFCPETKRSPEFMKIEVFHKILEQIKEHTEYIYLHVKGEPLLHPQIHEFLDLSYEKGFKVNITTNGTLLDQVKDKIIQKKSLRQMNISLHSFDANENSTDMDEYLNSILCFTREANLNTEIIVALRLWNLDENNITNIKKQRNRHILQVIEKEFNLPYKIEETISPGRGIKIADRIYLNGASEFKWPNLNEGAECDKGYCYALKNQVAILVDGTVVPCCLDGEGVINLGNIHEKNFSQIIQEERAINISTGFSRREVVEELCRKCDYRRRFDL